MPRATVDLTLALFVDLRGSSEMIEVWSQALEEKDPGTWSHCKWVAGFATALAQALRLDDKKIQVVAKGALLHEIGRLAIPKAILRKPAKLTPEEMLVMRESSTRGYEMLRNMPSLADAAEIVYAHRERFDGTGYPRGLKGGRAANHSQRCGPTENRKGVLPTVRAGLSFWRSCF